jgi:hypothetical protein
VGIKVQHFMPNNVYLEEKRPSTEDSMSTTVRNRPLRPAQSASFAFYLLHSGYKLFKKRLREELSSAHGLDLEECVDDESLYPLYQEGESTTFVMERLCGQTKGKA